MNQRFSHPSLNPFYLVLLCVRSSDVVQHVGGRSRMSLHLVSVIDLPHNYSCTYFYSKTKVETRKDSASFESPGSLNFVESRCKKFLKHLNLFIFINFIYFLYSFYYDI
jgi:hypothetical protein